MRPYRVTDLEGILAGTVKTVVKKACRRCNGTGTLGIFSPNGGSQSRILCRCVQVLEDGDELPKDKDVFSGKTEKKEAVVEGAGCTVTSV